GRADPARPGLVPGRADDPPQHLLARARGEAVPAVSSPRVAVEGRPQLGRLLEVLARVGDGPPAVGLRGGDRPAPGLGHQAALFHLGGAPAVEPGPRAPGPPWREELEAALVVQ